MTEKKTAPLISVIVPIYNVEEYLEETLDSVIAQSIGFKDNIQLILVNDGSPDSSEKICERYVAKYPGNILYIKQENAGVSAARNNGLEQATGTYVHCLDSDDILSKHAYKNVIGFLEKNKQVDFATMRLEFFDATLGEHPLNYKFSKGDRVVDVASESDALVFHAAASVFRRDKIISRFQSDIKISEDVRFLAEHLKENSVYGVVASATYFYRRRSNGLSAITGSEKNITFYTVTPYEVYEYMFNLFPVDDQGGVYKYAQHAVMYDLQWRLQQKSQSVLSSEEEKRYKKTIYSLIKKIDDEIILAQRNIGISHKLFALKIKYGSEESIPSFVIERLRDIARKDKPQVLLEFIEKRRDTVVFEGRVPNGSPLHDISVTLDKHTLSTTPISVKRRHIHFLGDLVYDGYVFKTTVADSDIASGSHLHVRNSGSPLHLVTKRQTRLPEARGGYTTINGKLMRNEGSTISFVDYAKSRHIAYEFIWIVRMLSSLRLKYCAKQLRMILKSNIKRKIPLKQLVKPFMIPLLDLVRNVRDLGIRVAYRIYRTKRPVWVVSDRFLAAGDNAEALFRYIKKRDDVPADVYFAISRKAQDYTILKQEFGSSIVDNTSFLYKMLFLRSTKIISSHADDFVINPFNWRVKNLYDLFSFDFVFLQHGVTRNDMSAWLNRYNKNIKQFVVCAQREYDSILHFDYYYEPNNVLLSGLPRYDLLEDDSKNKIILAPTWRHKLALEAIDASGNRPYNPDFKKTDYFEFYNKLMNDKRLIDAMKEHDVTGELYLHPSFLRQTDDFSENEVFTIKKFPYSYKTAFKEGSLLITDYSSVFFDFAYLGKPIILSQFDKDVIYDIHIYDEGYMDDENEGLGPVTRTYEDTVKEIIKQIEGGFVMNSTYKKRVEEFFKYHDKNNSKRVYEAIISYTE